MSVLDSAHGTYTLRMNILSAQQSNKSTYALVLIAERCARRPCSSIHDAQPAARARGEMFDVGAITRHDIGGTPQGQAHQRGIGNVRRPRLGEQRAGSMSSLFVQGNHLTAAKQAT